jgi:tRNA(fMet)-specific endonuclease VapC
MNHDPSEMAISGFTEAEIAFGVENSSLESRERNRTARSLAMTPFSRIYHDEEISVAYGKVKFQLVKDKSFYPQNEIDIFIAATAIAKDLILITQNLSDFELIHNLKIEDWSK